MTLSEEEWRDLKYVLGVWLHSDEARAIEQLLPRMVERRRELHRRLSAAVPSWD